MVIDKVSRYAVWERFFRIQPTGGNTMTTKTTSRLIGALFLAGFIVYGVGFGLVTSVI